MSGQNRGSFRGRYQPDSARSHYRGRPEFRRQPVAVEEADRSRFAKKRSVSPIYHGSSRHHRVSPPTKYSRNHVSHRSPSPHHFSRRDSRITPPLRSFPTSRPVTSNRGTAVRPGTSLVRDPSPIRGDLLPTTVKFMEKKIKDSVYQEALSLRGHFQPYYAGKNPYFEPRQPSRIYREEVRSYKEEGRVYKEDYRSRYDGDSRHYHSKPYREESRHPKPYRGTSYHSSTSYCSRGSYVARRGARGVQGHRTYEVSPIRTGTEELNEAMDRDELEEVDAGELNQLSYLYLVEEEEETRKSPIHRVKTPEPVRTGSNEEYVEELDFEEDVTDPEDMAKASGTLEESPTKQKLELKEVDEDQEDETLRPYLQQVDEIDKYSKELEDTVGVLEKYLSSLETRLKMAQLSSPV